MDIRIIGRTGRVHHTNDIGRARRYVSRYGGTVYRYVFGTWQVVS